MTGTSTFIYGKCPKILKTNSADPDQTASVYYNRDINPTDRFIRKYYNRDFK